MLDGENTRIDPLPEFMWIWRAWHRLSASRQWIPRGIALPLGGTIIESCPSFIPWEVVKSWAQHHGYTHAEMAFLDRCLAAMDGVFIRDHNKRLENRLKK
ncbi:hypothetical protein [Acetobacter pasteurianus]|uniref:Uncharacterized protein n=1 Tax=Acetobacter pasteurianus NBRC 3188 TaxID=1226663 RepID=A0A401WUF5_ACEPA|nr:hypothetical protein [Acetobacter pasteurianus]GCD52973.1 hypothetical protein NBRC3188_1670 [Acetobacter pasteurianus NBRC 3188]